MNYVNYVLDVEGVNPSTIHIKYNIDTIKEIVINISEEENQVQNKMQVKFLLDSKIQDVDNILKITAETVEHIINLLYIKVDGRFGLPKRGAYNINEKGTLAIGEMTLYNIKTDDLPKSLAEEIEQDLVNDPLLLKLKNDPYQRLYRAAMRTEDTIAKFMILYGILLALKITQKAVDALIKTKDPQVVMRKTTKPNKNDTETIFTWLRNQIGHTDDKTDLNKVEEEIAAVTNDLLEIVKKEIN